MKSCGIFQQYTYKQEDVGGTFTPKCTKPLVSWDDGACGSSPLKIASNGKADGTFTFCNAVAGTGCS